jgi:hypothetical protein
MTSGRSTKEISRILSARITLEKRELEKRLAILNRSRGAIERGDAPQSYNADGKARRKYPRVSQSSDAVGNMVGPREAAALVGRRHGNRSQN